MKINREQMNKLIENAESNGVPKTMFMDNLIERGYEIEGIDTKQALSEIQKRKAIRKPEVEQSAKDVGLLDRPGIKAASALIPGVNIVRSVQKGIDRSSETLEDVKQTFGGIKEAVTEGQEKTVEIGRKSVEGEQKPASGGLQFVGQQVQTTGNIISELIKGGVKSILTQEQEKNVKNFMKEAVTKYMDLNLGGGDTPGESLEELTAQYKVLKEKRPELAANLEAGAKIFEGAMEFATGGATAEASIVGRELLEQTTKQISKNLNDALKKVKAKVPEEKMLFKETDIEIPKSIEDLAVKADEAYDNIYVANLAKAKAEAPRVSFKEKLVGLRPDIKKQIAGKQDKLKQYFDIANGRNLDASLPTPLEIAGNQAKEARDVLQGQLNDVGSDIGQFRSKAKNLRAQNDQVENIQATFLAELDKLNLNLVEGKIIKKPGKVSKVQSSGDIKVLQELLEDFKTVKQNPTLENIIDYRSLVDGKINFGKSAMEASSSVDPLSRNLRKTIADEGATLVGKEQAAKLTEYSEIIDTLNELSGYVDRKAGGEFMLKRVLSERGGEPRALIQLIEQRTGINLLDDAVMARLATDVIGNDAQKGLFRQEIKNAGADVLAAISRGDTIGAASRFFEKGLDSILDQEKIFLEAAR